MTRKVIEYKDLCALAEEGLSQKEIAERLGVGRPAVTKALKKWDIALTRDVALRSAGKIVDEKLDAMAQLRRINSVIHAELDHIEETLPTVVSEKDRMLLQDQKLKHVAEIRKQLTLLLEIAKVLYNAEEIAKYQQTVLEVIGEVDAGVRSEIIRRLVERGSLARSTSWTP